MSADGIASLWIEPRVVALDGPRGRDLRFLSINPFIYRNQLERFYAPLERYLGLTQFQLTSSAIMEAMERLEDVDQFSQLYPLLAHHPRANGMPTLYRETPHNLRRGGYEPYLQAVWRGATAAVPATRLEYADDGLPMRAGLCWDASDRDGFVHEQFIAFVRHRGMESLLLQPFNKLTPVSYDLAAADAASLSVRNVKGMGLYLHEPRGSVGDAYPQPRRIGNVLAAGVNNGDQANMFVIGDQPVEDFFPAELVAQLKAMMDDAPRNEAIIDDYNKALASLLRMEAVMPTVARQSVAPTAEEVVAEEPRPVVVYPDFNKKTKPTPEEPR